MFFGRGALQLSWNYNYIDAATALAEDTLCDNPELIATNETMTWGTGELMQISAALIPLSFSTTTQ